MKRERERTCRALGHTFGVRVDGAGPEGCGRLTAAGYVEGLWWRLRRRLCRRVALLRSGGDSRSAAEGGGGALRAQIIKKPARALRHFDESRSAANRKASYCAG